MLSFGVIFIQIRLMDLANFSNFLIKYVYTPVAYLEIRVPGTQDKFSPLENFFTFIHICVSNLNKGNEFILQNSKAINFTYY